MGKFGISIPSVSIPASVSGPVKNAANKAKDYALSKVPEVKQFAKQKLESVGVTIPDADDIKAKILSQIPEADLAEMKAMGLSEDALMEEVKNGLPHAPTTEELKAKVKELKELKPEDIKQILKDRATNTITETKETINVMKDLKTAMDSGEDFQIPEKYLKGE